MLHCYLFYLGPTKKNIFRKCSDASKALRKPRNDTVLNCQNGKISLCLILRSQYQKETQRLCFTKKAVLPKKWKCPGLSSRSKEQKKEVEHLKRKTLKKQKEMDHLIGKIIEKRITWQ